MRILNTLSIYIILALALASCRHIEYVSFMTEEETGTSLVVPTVEGLYILNEGNMGSNKCTLDYLDLDNHSETFGTYFRNIYGERNPNTVLELGDVGNDIQIHDSLLWMVINCSNKVEVCEAATAHRIGQINIANCRYIVFDQRYAYISSYAGPVQINERSPLGRIYKVDTATLQKVDSVTVGYQPEEMAISDGKLYVANSGGYRVPYYDNRVMQIDLQSFIVEREIEIGINLHRLTADSYGQLWLSSRGDFMSQPSCLYWYNPATDEMGCIEHNVSAMTLVGDSLYCIGAEFNYQTGDYRCSHFLVDVQRHEVVPTTLFDAPEIASITLPYGIIVNPVHRDFYLLDAKKYVSSGELLHFLPDGSFDYRVRTGDIPSRGCFLINNSTLQ